MKFGNRGTVRGRHILKGFPGELVVSIAVAMLLLSPMGVQAAGPSGPAKPSTAVKFEDIPNSKLKRVILTARAAERLGIATAKVSEAVIVRKQMVGGRVIPPVENQPVVNLGRGGFGGFGQVAARQQQPVAPTGSVPKGEIWVEVTLTQGEWDRMRKDSPALILPLSMRDKTGKSVMANPTGIPPLEDPKRTMLKLYYKVPGKDHGLKLYHRVRVELQIEGPEDKQMVVPYSAVYYDGKGKAWVYINSKPLVYERKPITITRIEGDLAVLSDGPPVGTQIVTVGSALLFGAEVIFKR